MKQILQNLGSGETLLADVPAPGGRAGCLLVQTQASLVSLGTEKMLVDFGRSSLLDKARKQPEKVRQVLQKIKTDGLFATLDAVRTKLAEPIPLGYCATGVVVAVGAGVEGFAVGDRVACAAPHAEVVCVPKNLCAKVPAGVAPEDAVFTVLGAIALQGVRLLKPGLGDSVAVVGLGLVGLLATQLLLAAGARVLGTDFDPAKCALARRLGADAADLSTGVSATDAAREWSGGHGADAVLVAASAAGSAPMLQAVEICRKRGRVVQVGVTGVELPRPPLYEKEITVQVSCSYGPGRYDEHYEQDGEDYPFPYVRWTQQRNFVAILDLLARGRLRPGELVSHRIPFENALDAYRIVAGGKAAGAAGGGVPPLGIVLLYSEDRADKLARTITPAGKAVENGKDNSGGNGGVLECGTSVPLCAKTSVSRPDACADADATPHTDIQGRTDIPVCPGNAQTAAATGQTRMSVLPSTIVAPHASVSPSLSSAHGTKVPAKNGTEVPHSKTRQVSEDVGDDGLGVSGGRFLTGGTPAPLHAAAAARVAAPVVLGILGAGNFTGRTLLPAMKGLSGRRRAIVSASGVSAALLARRHGFEFCGTDANAVLGDAAVNAVFITTRHAAHAAQTLAALEAGKHVFVEKPLCLRRSELDAIAAAARARPAQILMVGFNRRFSPHTAALRRALAALPGPRSMVFTVNAGAVPASHWLQNPAVGGGRIVGEACHFIDLLRHLAGAPVTRASITWLGAPAGQPRDTATIQLAYADGSMGTVHYFANGDKSFPKERLEIFAAGRVLAVDNFRKTVGYGVSGGSTLCRGWRQDKGHAAELAAFFNAIETAAPAPIPLDEILETTRITHELAAAADAAAGAGDVGRNGVGEGNVGEGNVGEDEDAADNAAAAAAP